MRTPSVTIPIEIYRTIVAISEAGSLSKAATMVGLSQPAVSSQIKRAESSIGGALFQKTTGGSSLTRLGSLVVHQARRILDANDQVLSMGGMARQAQPIRLGVPSLYIKEFLQRNDLDLSNVFVHTDNSIGIVKDLIDGYIDIACVIEPEDRSGIEQLIVKESVENFVWVRSRTFVLSPGAPIPLLNWPELSIDSMLIQALTKNGLAYRITFKSPDYHAKLAAAAAGMGLMAFPQRMIPPDLVHAKEYYLPALPPVKLLLCVRSSEKSQEVEALADLLTRLFFDEQPTNT
ncbi:LysR family transcriptional regulator [Tardiphaga sp.]|uniref:LysR family transcriptional regulator n=1 Tax=Tardiphaga sp. TaxID=1926292 RepID=UPI002626DA97|nr:LysR family transcriptional regulator [Tardiphaga sp.]MDB5619280.1 LysR family transcriptional regulator [Tardiphaga sp.]